MKCAVCNHEHRADIEGAILSMSPESDVTIKSIAEDYDVPESDVKLHALMHCQMGAADADKSTIAKQLKLREADMLLAVVNEYMVTLKTVGRRVNKLANDAMFEKLINKSVVDLYVGMGGEIRNTVKTLAELNSILNGPDNGNASGLQALAAAISGSKVKSEE